MQNTTEHKATVELATAIKANLELSNSGSKQTILRNLLINLIKQYRVPVKLYLIGSGPQQYFSIRPQFGREINLPADFMSALSRISYQRTVPYSINVIFNGTLPQIKVKAN